MLGGRCRLALGAAAGLPVGSVTWFGRSWLGKVGEGSRVADTEHVNTGGANLMMSAGGPKLTADFCRGKTAGFSCRASQGEL